MVNSSMAASILLSEVHPLTSTTGSRSGVDCGAKSKKVRSNIYGDTDAVKEQSGSVVDNGKNDVIVID